MQRIDFTSIGDLEAARGRRLGASDWLVVTQDLIDDFARVTNDPQWIHVDPERARRESPLGTTIAHGLLTLSLLPSFIQQCVAFSTARMSLNYGFDRVRFVSPVPVGSRLRGAFRVDEVTTVPGGAQITWLAEVEIEGSSKPALSARWISRVLFADADATDRTGDAAPAR